MREKIMKKIGIGVPIYSLASDGLNVQKIHKILEDLA